jgi:hypothetical protein
MAILVRYPDAEAAQPACVADVAAEATR